MALPGPTPPPAVAAIVGQLKGWLTSPFTRAMDPLDYALCVVLVLTIAYMWSRVLRHTFGER